MEGFVHFFEQMPTWQRLVWVAICLTAGWIAENNRPLFRFDYRKWSHARVNLVLFVTVAGLRRHVQGWACVQRGVRGGLGCV